MNYINGETQQQRYDLAHCSINLPLRYAANCFGPLQTGKKTVLIDGGKLEDFFPWKGL